MLYILSSLSKDQDSIYLNPKDISESSGYAKSAINLSLNELEANEFIKRVGGRGNKYQFWLNPFKIFKGKRIEYFKEFKEDAIKMLPGYTVTLD